MSPNAILTLSPPSALDYPGVGPSVSARNFLEGIRAIGLLHPNEMKKLELIAVPVSNDEKKLRTAKIIASLTDKYNECLGTYHALLSDYTSLFEKGERLATELSKANSPGGDYIAVESLVVANNKIRSSLKEAQKRGGYLYNARALLQFEKSLKLVRSESARQAKLVHDYPELRDAASTKLIELDPLVKKCAQYRELKDSGGDGVKMGQLELELRSARPSLPGKCALEIIQALEAEWDSAVQLTEHYDECLSAEKNKLAALRENEKRLESEFVEKANAFTTQLEAAGLTP